MSGGRGVHVFGLLAIVAVAGGVGLLAVSRRAKAQGEERARTSAVEAGPHVSVIDVAAAAPERNLLVQAEARPYASVTLYAKVSGYLREVKVDKGDRVAAGQVLAVIESPELDRQYEGAVADARNKRANAKRAEKLVEQGILSAQDADTIRTDAEVADASVASLASQKAYEVLRAPFEGTITARFADPGALVQNAASAQTSALPVVTISEADQLRVTAYVDQTDAPYVRVGDAAAIDVPGRPEKLHGTVSRMSRELDSRTRMMLAEVDLDNRGGQVVPGSFVQVSFKLRAPAGLQIPDQALVLRGTKPFVALVDAENRVSYRPVKIGEDDGQNVVILDGLAPGDRVALNLGDSVSEGSRVQPIAGDKR